MQGEKQSMIKKGDKVRVIRIAPDADELTREHISCFLGQTGIVKTEPAWLAREPGKPLGLASADGECMVEFDHACSQHNERSVIFEVYELEKVEN
jgi:hypothetical protein